MTTATGMQGKDLHACLWCGMFREMSDSSSENGGEEGICDACTSTLSQTQSSPNEDESILRNSNCKRLEQGQESNDGGTHERDCTKHQKKKDKDEEELLSLLNATTDSSQVQVIPGVPRPSVSRTPHDMSSDGAVHHSIADPEASRKSSDVQLQSNPVTNTESRMTVHRQNDADSPDEDEDDGSCALARRQPPSEETEHTTVDSPGGRSGGFNTTTTSDDSDTGEGTSSSLDEEELVDLSMVVLGSRPWKRSDPPFPVLINARSSKNFGPGFEHTKKKVTTAKSNAYKELAVDYGDTGDERDNEDRRKWRRTLVILISASVLMLMSGAFAAVGVAISFGGHQRENPTSSDGSPSVTVVDDPFTSSTPSPVAVVPEPTDATNDTAFAPNHTDGYDLFTPDEYDLVTSTTPSPVVIAREPNATDGNPSAPSQTEATAPTTGIPPTSLPTSPIAATATLMPSFEATEATTLLSIPPTSTSVKTTTSPSAPTDTVATSDPIDAPKTTSINPSAFPSSDAPETISINPSASPSWTVASSAPPTVSDETYAPLTAAPTSPLTQMPSSPPTAAPTSPITQMPSPPPTAAPTPPITQMTSTPPTAAPTSPVTHMPSPPQTAAPTSPVTHMPSPPAVTDISAPTTSPTNDTVIREGEKKKKGSKNKVEPSDAVFPSFSFYVLGDVPYSDKEGELLKQQMNDLQEEVSSQSSADTADFAVHVGDLLKAKVDRCTPASYDRAVFGLVESPVPVIVIPGDNDWNDCPDPVVAWDRFSSRFQNFEQGWSNSTIPSMVTRADYRWENFVFFHHNVLFMGFNMVAGLTGTADNFTQRMDDNLQWLHYNVEQYLDQARAVVIFGHSRRGKIMFKTLRTLFSRIDGLHVIFIHGNGHKWEVESPYRLRETKPWKTFWRIQVDQGYAAPPIKVRIRGTTEEALQETFSSDGPWLRTFGQDIQVDRRGGTYEKRVVK